MELKELGEVVYEDDGLVIVHIDESLGVVARQGQKSPVAFHEKHLEWGVYAAVDTAKRFEKSGLVVHRKHRSIDLEADGGGTVRLTLETAKTVLAEIAD